MGKWEDEGENTLWLFTPAEFAKLPDGIVLETIGGEFATKGKDYIDNDIRFGHLAYGVRRIHEHPESELLLTFQLSK